MNMQGHTGSRVLTRLAGVFLVRVGGDGCTSNSSLLAIRIMPRFSTFSLAV